MARSWSVGVSQKVVVDSVLWFPNGHHGSCQRKGLMTRGAHLFIRPKVRQVCWLERLEDDKASFQTNVPTKFNSSPSHPYALRYSAPVPCSHPFHCYCYQ